MDDTPKQDEDPATLEAHIMDSRVAKSAAEWWARDEIIRLRERVKVHEEEIERLRVHVEM